MGSEVAAAGKRNNGQQVVDSDSLRFIPVIFDTSLLKQHHSVALPQKKEKHMNKRRCFLFFNENTESRYMD
jgi:hypothetical protein